MSAGVIGHMNPSCLHGDQYNSLWGYHLNMLNPLLEIIHQAADSIHDSRRELGLLVVFNHYISWQKSQDYHYNTVKLILILTVLKGQSSNKINLFYSNDTWFENLSMTETLALWVVNIVTTILNCQWFCHLYTWHQSNSHHIYMTFIMTILAS